MEKIIYVCPECGSKKIQGLEWVDLNTGESHGSGEGDLWCDGCKDHFSYAITEEEYKEMKEDD